MSRSRKGIRKENGRPRRVSVRAVRRQPPDLRKLSRALIHLALAQAAAEAAAEAQATESTRAKTEPERSDD